MTIQTPISDVSGGTGHPEASGLPDLASLNRLAGEFFAQLPGVVQLAPRVLPVLRTTGLASGLPVGLSTDAPEGMSSSLPGGLGTLPTGLPVNPPGSFPVGRPPASSVAAPAGTGILVPSPLSAPAAPSVAQPSLSSSLPSAAPVSVSSLADTHGTAPYYFLDYDRPAAPSAGNLDQFASLADPQSSIAAQSGQLPGQDPLVLLLSELYPDRAASPVAGTTAVSSASGSAYDAGGRTLVQPAGPSLSPSFEQPLSWDRAPNHIQYQAQPPFDVHAIRRDFPILSERVNGRPLVWFDNAATTQKPQAVIDRISYFYAHENSNIHRAAHELAARATDAYEGARNTVARFIGAKSSGEIIFVRGTTEGINLVAQTFGKQQIGAGDEIIISHLEHHANIVPWQQLADQTGARLRVIPVDDTGQILLDEYRKLLNPRTKLVSVTQVSNALGTVTPVKQIIDLGHQAGARVMIDGAQGLSHASVNVQQLDADFYVFSGHKIFGPTGIGVVYGKQELLDQLPPWQGGGNMIADVTFERTQYQPAPARFEAGTGNIADAVGLGAALEYVERIGMANIALYEHGLLEYATHGLLSIPGLRLIGTAQNKASVSSFVLSGYKTGEVGHALNQEGIAVRSGHHCAQPILRRFGVEASVRPSLAFYNTCEEIDHMIAVLRRLAGSRRS